jgi:hypothetical protein
MASRGFLLVSLLLLAMLTSGCTAPHGTPTTTGPGTSVDPEPAPVHVRWRVGLNVTVVNYANQEEGVPQVNENCVTGEQADGEELRAIHVNATAGGGNLVTEWTLRIDVYGGENRTILTTEGPLPLQSSYYEDDFVGGKAGFSIRVVPKGSPLLAVQEKVNLDLTIVTLNPHELNLDRERIHSCS